MGKRIQKVSLNNLESRVLNLGYVGEHEHTRIEIDCTDVLWDYPNAECSMVVQPPTGDMYPLTPVREENSIIWLVTDSDVVYNGTGRVQITFTNDGEIVKSAIANTRIDQSIMATGPVPTPLENWIEQAEETARQMAQDAADATVEDLAEEKEAAIADIQAQETATETAIAQAAADARASIPSDYTQLSDDVTSLESAMNDKADKNETPENVDTDAEDVDLDFTDKNGNVLMRLKDGHIQTKEFDSSDILNIKPTREEDADLYITDKYGNVIGVFYDGYFKTKKFDAKPIVEAFDKLTQKEWAGKKWVVIGDSLTEVNKRTTKNYHYYIAEKTGIEVVNLGHSGAGYYARPDDFCFRIRATQVPLDADVVTIFGSGNDLSKEPLGDVTDTTSETLCGCINITLDNLYARMPVIQLGIVTPSPWVGNTPIIPGRPMELYSEALVEICRRRSIPCLDLYHCSNLRPDDATFRELAFSKDEGGGVHPDETGHFILASRFEAFLRTLLL